MADTPSPTRPPQRTPGTPTTPPSGTSRQGLILLALMLGAMWFWKANSEEAAQPAIPYSQLYKWIDEGKVASVVIDGEVVDASLKSPENVDGRQIKDLRTNAVPNDSSLLPLLHEKDVKITVKSQKQPFAVQVLFTLLPWVLIIGLWLWMSRRAQRDDRRGRPARRLDRRAAAASSTRRRR